MRHPISRCGPRSACSRGARRSRSRSPRRWPSSASRRFDWKWRSFPGPTSARSTAALGHIEDTALPGAVGNAGIAGHRDGFFRGLKDILPGDTIEIDTLVRKEIYRVERTWIVDPSDVSVLDPTPSASLTLVTCYPFYFVGSAPQRFIVRAVRVDGERLSSHVREQFGSSQKIRMEKNL